MSAPVIHFEIHAKDRIAMGRFYEQVFGWATMEVEEMPYTLVFPTGDVTPGIPPKIGIGGGITDRIGPSPAPDAPVSGFACIISVDDLPATYEAVKAHGGTIAMETFNVPGTGDLFYFKDPDGNIVGALKEEPMD